MQFPKNDAPRSAPGQHRKLASADSALRPGLSNLRRQLSYREICEIMGRPLPVIEPNERQLELFEEQ